MQFSYLRGFLAGFGFSKQPRAPLPKDEGNAASRDALPRAEREGPSASKAVAAEALPRNAVFDVHPSGELVLDAAAGRRLAALADRLGPEPGLRALEEVEQVVQRALPPQQASEALRLLRHYQSFARAEAEALACAQSHADAEAIRGTLDRLAEQRRRRVGFSAARALYGEQEMRARSRLDALNSRKATGLQPANEEAFRPQPDRNWA